MKSSINSGRIVERNAPHTNLRGILCMFILSFFVMDILSCKNDNNGGKQEITQVQNSDSLAQVRDTLQSQFNAAHFQIDLLVSKNAALDSQLERKNSEIARLKVKISGLEKNNRAYAADLKKDKEIINSLKGFGEKAKELAVQLGILENDKMELVRQRDSLVQQYKRLKELGSVLHASNIRLAAIHLKHHGKKEKNTTRARKADILKVSFDIDENRIAKDGIKDLYLVITDPAGNLLSNPMEGSGITVTGKGNNLNYSLLKEVSLKQNEEIKGINVDWKQESDYSKGVYSIAIYNDGYKIGGGKVTLN